jgi:hypothetical protein
MSSEEGGVGTSTSSSVRRCRFSRAAFVAGADVAGRRADALVFRVGLARLDRAFVRLTTFWRLTNRFGPPRFRFGPPRFFVRLACFRPRLTARLGITASFQNLDSLAISIVLSVAYRKSASPALAVAVDQNLRGAGPRTQVPGNRSIEEDQ